MSIDNHLEEWGIERGSAGFCSIYMHEERQRGYAERSFARGKTKHYNAMSQPRSLMGGHEALRLLMDEAGC